MGETPLYNVANDAAIVCEYGEADQLIIGGLNSLTLPAYTAGTIDVQEFRKIDISFAGAKKIGEIAYSGNMAVSDAGQRYLAQKFDSQEKLTKTRLYIDANDFVAPDLAKDPNSGFQVNEASPGAGSKGNVYPYSGKMVVNGAVVYFYKHYTDVAVPVMAFVDGLGSEDTITGVPGSLGLKAGDTIIIEGSTSNDGQYLVQAIITTTVTITGKSVFTAESAIEGTVIHGGTI